LKNIADVSFSDVWFSISKFMLKFFILNLFIFNLILLIPARAQPDISFNAKDEYYKRILQISGLSDDPSSYGLRPAVFNAEYLANPWSRIFTDHNRYVLPFGNVGGLALFEPVWFQSYNTALPKGGNDGAIWQGRGYNTAFSAGMKLELGPLHVQFRPVTGMAQNRDFDLGPYRLSRISAYGIDYEPSEFAYSSFRAGVDYVQRYGDEAYRWYDLGESSIDLRYGGFMVSASNKKIFTGPAHNVSLQFGYNAPGFRHLYVGTYRPLMSAIGNFEFAYIFGGIRESDYFTVNKGFGMLSVNSLIVVYKPGFSEGFSIGFIRSYFHPYPDSFDQYWNQAKKLFEPGLREAIEDNGEPRGADPDNQIGSVFFRYFLPDHQFEIYGEYGRNDHSGNWRDFRAQPNHHRAYTIGGTKTMFLPKNRLLAVNIEINQLEAMRTALIRGESHLGGWYTHTSQVLGFSNTGQILGSPYGPGVNLQKIRGEVLGPSGGIALKIARITYHNSRMDQYFDQVLAANQIIVERWEVRNIELLFGAEITAFLKYGLELSAVIEQSIIFNHHHILDNDRGNTRMELVFRKNVRGWRR